MYGPWNASVVDGAEIDRLAGSAGTAPANFGSVMSGLVELGVMVARPPWLRIGDIALPEPLVGGPIAATSLLSETILRALVAACAGSYWPAVAVPSSGRSTIL